MYRQVGFLFFFFSSRRRHTRCLSDWSSDVCSSDLGRIAVPASSVVRIEEGHSTLQEYDDRASRIPAGDASAWIALGEWASAQGLSSQETRRASCRERVVGTGGTLWYQERERRDRRD